jgi:hypothetical protein
MISYVPFSALEYLLFLALCLFLILCLLLLPLWLLRLGMVNYEHVVVALLEEGGGGLIG